MFGPWRGMWFGKRGMHGHGPMAMIARAGVELSDEQVEKLAEIRGDGMFQFSEQGAGMMMGMREMMQYLTKPNIDKDAIRKLHKEMQEKRNKMGDQFVERVISIAEVLTPEQRQQVKMHMLRAPLGLGQHDHEHDDCDMPPPPGPPRRRR